MPIIIIFFIVSNLITQTRFGGGVFSKSSNLFKYELIIVIFCIVFILLIFDFLFIL